MHTSVDKVLERIGGYGKFQILMLQIAGLIEFALSAFNVSIITFIAAEPTWECVPNSTICNITDTINTISDDYTARCNMPRSEWKFSDTFTSAVTEVCMMWYHQVSLSFFAEIFWYNNYPISILYHWYRSIM